MLRKSIHFRESDWLLLQSYMRANMIDSPSLAIEQLIQQLIRKGSVHDRTKNPTDC